MVDGSATDVAVVLVLSTETYRCMRSYHIVVLVRGQIPGAWGGDDVLYTGVPDPSYTGIRNGIVTYRFEDLFCQSGLHQAHRPLPLQKEEFLRNVLYQTTR
jgi:hypothetical protein